MSRRWQMILVAMGAVWLAGCGDDDVLATDPKLTGLAGDDVTGQLDGSVVGDSTNDDVGLVDAATDDDADGEGDAADTVDAACPTCGPDADVEAADAVDADTGPACPGAAGCPCVADTECADLGACLPAASGKACALPCKSGLPCANGTTCVPLPGAATDGTEDKTVCAPKWPTLCDPCLKSDGCMAVGSPAAKCVSAEKSPGQGGWYCATPCKADADCPTSYACAAATIAESGEGAFCVPTSGICACSAAALGFKTSCASVLTKPDGTVISGCSGERTCGSDGLTACSAPIPATETCNGKDDDCDGATDQGAACDDGNLCTTDACVAGACAVTPTTAPCDDGSACTTEDHCQDGACTGATKVCDDANACTQDACQPATGCTATSMDGAPCSDGTACTKKDTCMSGVCAGAKLECDDANACTDDACDPAVGCTHKPNKGPCDDGSACTAGDHCGDGACGTAAVVCDDGFACTTDSCDAKAGCQFTAVADPACGTVVPPYAQPFTCGGASLAYWQLSGPTLPKGSVRWAVDALPNPPGFQSPDCSLNVNNGVDLGCSGAQTVVAATADSPLFDATALAPNAPLLLRFGSAGAWPTAGAGAMVARVLGRPAGGVFAQLFVVAPGNSWQTLSVDLKAWAGTKFQLRLELAGPCSLPPVSTGQTGWFVDDWLVAVNACGFDNGGCAEKLCSLGADGKAVCTACPGGFVAKNGVCTDVDECSQPGVCAVQAACANTAGSFTCTCKAGWQGDGKTCADVDECGKKTDGCAAGACVNTPGSFQCTCPKDQYGDGKTCVKKGGSAQYPAISCLEIFTIFPGSADGVYWLDFDGVGAGTAGQYLCDMKGGGWTLLIWDDFEDGKTKNWSSGAVSNCGKFGNILGGAGQFGKGAETQKTVPAPPHTQVKLSLKYLRIDSWWFEVGSVRVDGNEVWNKKGTGGLILNGSHECGTGAITDEDWDMGWTGAHAAATLTVLATSDLDKNANTESFGIDNVVAWVK